MAETAERSYRVIRAEDGRYAVQVTPNEENAPLTISGFKSEDEALASPSEIPNCERCGQLTTLVTVIHRLGDSPTYRIFECQSCNVLKWIAEQVT